MQTGCANHLKPKDTEFTIAWDKQLENVWAFLTTYIIYYIYFDLTIKIIIILFNKYY